MTTCLIVLIAALRAVESANGADPRCGGNELQITRICVQDANRIAALSGSAVRWTWADRLDPAPLGGARRRVPLVLGRGLHAPHGTDPDGGNLRPHLERRSRRLEETDDRRVLAEGQGETRNQTQGGKMKTRDKMLKDAANDFAQKARRRKRRRLSAALRIASDFASTPRTITDSEGALWRVVEDCNAQKLVRDLRKLGEVI